MEKNMGKSRKTWTSIAERILAESQRPLDSREIADIAFEKGLKTRSSDTPEYSVQAAILRDIKSGRGDASPFVVFGDGQETRKYWLRSKVT